MRNCLMTFLVLSLTSFFSVDLATGAGAAGAGLAGAAAAGAAGVAAFLLFGAFFISNRKKLKFLFN